MSKNITIQEGGIARAFTANRLRTALAEGGSCLWVPEDEVKLGRKTVSRNGTYLAADDGLFGFSQFTVKGVGTVRGKAADGRRYVVGADDDGNLTYTELAETLRLTALPEVLNYGDGANIRFDGLAAAACDGEGRELFEVPFEALEFPVTVADLAEARPSRGAVGDYALDVMPLSGWMSDHRYDGAVNYNVVETSGDTIYMFPFENNHGHNTIYYLSTQPFRILSRCVYAEEWRQEVVNVNNGGYDPDVELYVGIDVGNYTVDRIRPPLSVFYTYQQFVDFWTLLKQSRQVEALGGQAVPVRWARDGDGEVLETSFSINVIPAGGHGED